MGMDIETALCCFEYHASRSDADGSYWSDEDDKHKHTDREAIDEVRAHIASLEAELAHLRKVEEAARPHIEEALEVLIGAIEDQDFQPCFDQENFMVGPSLLGHLSRAYDAVLKVRTALGDSDG